MKGKDSAMELLTSQIANDVLDLRSSPVEDPIPHFPFVRIIPNPTGDTIFIVRVFCRIHSHSLHWLRRGGTHEQAFAILRESDGQPFAGVVADLSIGRGARDATTFVERDWNYYPHYIELKSSDSLIITAFAFSSASRVGNGRTEMAIGEPPLMRFGIFAVMGYTTKEPK